MSTKTLVPLHSFTVATDQEVDQINTRIEGEGASAKTVTETTKVVKTVNIPFCFKIPSRVENEEADIVRASWWSKFVERGVMPEAMLIKLYTNQGGTMPEEYRKLLETLQVELFELQEKLLEAEVLHKDDIDLLRPMRLRYFDLREQITKIHRTQAPFFENTAESKAREKHIEWLVLYMSYYKPHQKDETQGEWIPFFPGKTVEEKLDSYDKMIEKKDELLLKSKDMLQLIATFYSSTNGNVSGQQIADFVETDEEWAGKV